MFRLHLGRHGRKPCAGLPAGKAGQALGCQRER